MFFLRSMLYLHAGGFLDLCPALLHFVSFSVNLKF